MLAFVCACCTGSLCVGWCKSRGKERPVLSRLVWTLLSCCSLVSCCLLTWSLSSLVWTLPPVPCSRLFCDWSLHCSTTCLLWHVQLHWEEPSSQRLSMRKALLAMNMTRHAYIHTYGRTLLALSRHFGAETKKYPLLKKGMKISWSLFLALIDVAPPRRKTVQVSTTWHMVYLLTNGKHGSV